MNDIIQIVSTIHKHDVSDEQRKLLESPVNEGLVAKNKYANNSNYVSESVYRRILNQATNCQWSFIPYKIRKVGEGKDAFIEYIGLLIIPGFGVHTGIGTQLLNKKDNQNAVAVAKTYAFKNACKEAGLAPNVGDENFDEDLFDIEIEDDKPAKPKKKTSSKKKASSKPSSDKSAGLTVKEQIEEIREAYDLDNDDDFVAFLQIWDEEILELGEMDKQDWKDFLAFFKKNKKKFEDF